MRLAIVAPLVVSAVIAVVAAGGAAPSPAAPGAVLTGKAAYGDWRSDAPGLHRHLSADDLPVPYASRSSGNS